MLCPGKPRRRIVCRSVSVQLGIAVIDNHTDSGVSAVPKKATLTVLDVGHGSCAVLAGDHDTILFDTGPGVAVLEYLRREGIRKIDSVVISHADADHISGLVAMLLTGEFVVEEIVANADALKRSDKWSNLAWTIDYLKRNGGLRAVERLCEGDVITTGIEAVKLTVLAPRLGLVLTGPGAKDPSGRLITSNSASAVILVEFGDRRVALLTGDMDEVGFAHLTESGQDLQAEVLVFPHHGGLGGGTIASTVQFAEELVRAVNPSDVVFSLDRRKFGNPRPEVIAAVRRAAPQARIACTELAESCAKDLTADAPVHLLPLYASGMDRQSCCAGTMRVTLVRDGELEPSRDVHRAFVERCAGTALCMERSGAGEVTA